MRIFSPVWLERWALAAIILLTLWTAGLLPAVLVAILLLWWLLRRKDPSAEALRETNRILETLIDNLPGFVYRCNNDRDWTMEYLGGRFRDVTGYAPKDLIDNRNIPFNHIINKEHQEWLWALWQESLAKKEPLEVEYAITTATGDVKWVWEQGRGVYDDDGRLLALEGFICDITDRRLAEEERRKLELQLGQSRKLEAVGQLAGGVAHDFNNILTVILGHVDLGLHRVRGELGSDKGLLQSLEQIQEAARRAADLTRQLLTFSRRDVMQPKILGLNQILSNLHRMLQRLITEDISLKTIIAPDLLSVKADVGQLEQVIVNLVINGVHAMPHGGRLTLETRNVTLDEDYVAAHADAQPGPHILLAVSDTGHGMDAATMERIFEPFFTTKSVDKGTGLGLATVHGIVRRSGGHIMVYSEPGRGTTFKVYLPAVHQEPEALRPETQPDIHEAAHGTILFCEDDLSVRRLTSRSLRRAGYTVLEAGYGKDALTVCKDYEGPIDLLITDVIMPDMNGRALSEALRQGFGDLPTLYISGYTVNVIAHHGVLDDDVEFLEKPFTRQALLSKVHRVLTSKSEAP